MRAFLQATADGISLAAVYALAAASFVIVYRATRVFNFAEGAMMLLGGYAVYELMVTDELPTGLAIPLAIAAVAVLGAVIYLAVLRPMTGQPVFAQVIVTMGISVAVLGIVAVYWGFAPLPLAAPFDGPPVHIGGTVVNQFNLVSTVFTVVVISAVALFFEYTPVGLQMRAAAESATLASRRGVNLQKVYLLAWVLAGAVAGLAGVLIAFRSNGATPILEAVGLRAFPAALIGGFESLKGAALGALFVGLAQTYATLLWGANVQDAVVFGLMLVFLMMRPYGLFGTREVLRV